MDFSPERLGRRIAIMYRTSSLTIKEIALQNIELPSRRVGVLCESDVVVIGGGTAGFIAAIAAARSGARTVLLERNGFLGGCATATYNNNLSASHDSEGQRIMGGIGWEFMQRMVAEGHALYHYQKGNHTPTQLFPEHTKTLALRLVHDAGVELFLHTWCGETLQENEVVRGVVVRSKSGTQVVLGKVFVDCSADADVVAQAGGRFEMTPLEHRYTTTVDLTVCNVDAPKLLAWAREHARELGMKFVPADHDRSDGLRAMVTVPVKGPQERRLEDGTLFREHRALQIKIMIHRSVCRVQGHVRVEGTDVRDLTRAEYEGRLEAMENLAYLRAHVPGMEDAFVIGNSPLGVRETRRIVGDYRLTLEDVLEQRRFPDVIGLNCRAIDKHEKNDRFYLKMLQGNHDIPPAELASPGIGKCDRGRTVYQQ